MYITLMTLTGSKFGTVYDAQINKAAIDWQNTVTLMI